MPRKTRGITSSVIVQVAREARRKPTPAEQKLWEAIRGRKLAGLKFRHQHPYGRFILDAFCVEHQLEIEIDGGIHSNSDQRAYDAARTEYLNLHDIRVLRFTNDQVLDHLDEVLSDVLKAIKS
jgi:very-short-patch-repair endonuclease